MKEVDKLTFERMTDLLRRADAVDAMKYYHSHDLSIIFTLKSIVGLVIRSGHIMQLPDYRCGFCSSGKALARFNLVERELHPGMLIFLTPGTIIEPIEASDDFALSGMAVSSERLHIAMGGALPSILNGQVLDGRIDVEDTKIAIINNILHMMIILLNEKDHSDKVIDNLISAIYNEYDQIFTSRQEEQHRLKTNEREIFDRFIYLVNKHCHKEHQISFYAEKMCLTERYLGTVVKRASSRTPKEWIDQALITASKIQLRHSNEPINRIADNLHFPNYSFFSKFFKRLTGMTPVQYREKK